MKKQSFNKRGSNIFKVVFNFFCVFKNAKSGLMRCILSRYHFFLFPDCRKFSTRSLSISTHDWRHVITYHSIENIFENDHFSFVQKLFKDILREIHNDYNVLSSRWNKLQ